jgi:hypothetical protein
VRASPRAQDRAKSFDHGEFFHERDYPGPLELDAIFAKLTKKPVARETLQRRAGINRDCFDKALEKLERLSRSDDYASARALSAWLKPS